MKLNLKTYLALLPLTCFGCFNAGTTTPSARQTLPFLVSESTRLELAEEPAILSELESSLTEYFGTRYAPRYRVLDEWQVIGMDPNASPFLNAPFGTDLEGRRPGTLRADNARFFARELRAIEEGRAETIGRFRRQPVLSRNWESLLANAESKDTPAFRKAATRFFIERYPDLEEGSVIFTNSCARCHGANGAGDGPMSSRLIPRPRNYRAGLFKFAAVEAPSKPRREDLLRTLIHGLPGSAMPSFRNRSVAELNAFVDQIRLLSIRGEVERRLLFEWTDAEIPPSEAIEEVYAAVWQDWINAAGKELNVVVPAPVRSTERLARGRELFLDEGAANCVSCHGTGGRGDGKSAFEADADGQKTALLRDEWGNFIAPRDFSTGVFRGGERREDLYLRIHCGIPGTPMPALGGTDLTSEAGLQAEADRWCLVDFVLWISDRGPLAGLQAP